MLYWLVFLFRAIVRPKTCCKNETWGPEMLCQLQFGRGSIVRPKTCYKKRDMMLDYVLLAVALDQINCTAQDLLQEAET